MNDEINWQPMDTAPKNGMPIWVRGHDHGLPDGDMHCTIAWWAGNHWRAAALEYPRGAVKLEYLDGWVPLT
jgi:hypothetical protein